MLLLAGQEAERGVGVAADQDGVAALEDLVEGGDADGRESLAVVVGGGSVPGTVDDTVDGSQGKGVVEEGAEEFDDAAERTVTDEDEGEDELGQPGLGDGQVKQDMVVGGEVGVEGEAEGVLGVAGGPVDELAADLVLGGEGQDLTLGGAEGLGGTGGGREWADGEIDFW